MTFATLLAEIRRKHRYATADDVRNTFGDYHNVLHWLATFLIGDETDLEAYMVDACGLAESQTESFHDWLVHWAARATVRYTLQGQRSRITELAAVYEKRTAMHVDHPPISVEQFHALVTNSEDIYEQLDVLCRFVLIVRGIAKESLDEAAAELGISREAAESAYCVAFDALCPELLSN